MALDGAFLHILANEISESILNTRVEKISQPSKEEIIISFRFKGGSRKLLLCANANSPRIHFTDIALENPKSPPMFCMLLRKHLMAGRLVAVTQSGLDRVLCLEFEAVNELGDLTVVKLIIEIMGRHSNIIMVNSDGKVIDSIKRVNGEISSVRMVLPGITYQAPPAQDKLNLLTTDIGDIMKRFNECRATDIAKALMNTLEGISPILAREIASRATKGQDIAKENLSNFYKERVSYECVEVRGKLLKNDIQLTMVEDEREKLRDFTFIDILQYGSGIAKTNFDTASEMLDHFYADRDRVSRMKQRSHDLLKLLINATDRITKKLALQATELQQCANRDTLKVYGDLINSNLYSLEKGQGKAILQNFYEEGCPEVEIKLDKRLTPVQNAQHYYAEYRKAATAEEMLSGLMAKSEQELIYLDSVFDAVSRTQGESELLEIRQELAEQGYIRATKQKSRMLKAQPPIKYKSDDGFSILCGRNNKQNDMLTLKVAKKQDLWLHTQTIAGSHVIIEGDDREISDLAITQAAIIAAFNSKGRNSAQVGVDYTYVRYVKKPAGAKPGMVIFTDYSTAYVTPDEELVKRLLVK